MPAAAIGSSGWNADIRSCHRLPQRAAKLLDLLAVSGVSWTAAGAIPSLPAVVTNPCRLAFILSAAT